MARDVESYVHRIGRTGRAGELGESITFWNPDYDKECTPALCRIARDAGQEAGHGARGPRPAARSLRPAPPALSSFN
jgi:superfamily II DNA/RNA helicase